MKVVDWGARDLFPGPSFSGVTHKGQVFPDCVLAELQSVNTVVRMKQVHGNDCRVIEASDLALASDEVLEVPNVDAVVTNEVNVLLAVKTADCLPILIWHPSGIIGAVHAGRRGSIDEIIVAVLAKIRSTWGVDRDFRFYFGPAITVANYQIDRERDLYYDLRAENKAQIERVLGEGNFEIFDDGECTYEAKDKYYSYRRDGAKSGRIWSVILKK